MPDFSSAATTAVWTGAPGHGGSCLPEGAPPHRYVLAVHALSVACLPLNAKASAAMLGDFTHATRLRGATLEVSHGR
jgi:hypothetical protein